MSDLVGHPENRFSRVAVQIMSLNTTTKTGFNHMRIEDGLMKLPCAKVFITLDRSIENIIFVLILTNRGVIVICAIRILADEISMIITQPFHQKKMSM